MILPGAELEWRISITNRSTQDKVLMSIEMPQQRQKNFILRAPALTRRLQVGDPAPARCWHWARLSPLSAACRSAPRPQRSRRQHQTRSRPTRCRSPPPPFDTQVPSLKNPIKVAPGGTHTQSLKFVTKRHELGAFRHTLLLNFSNFIYEHVLVVNVSTPKAASPSPSP